MIMTEIDDRRNDLLMNEASISLSLTSIMSMVVFVFIGLLLQTEKEALSDLKIPLIYLFISAVTLLYSTIIYANVSGNIARLNNPCPDNMICHANILAEIGFYFMIFSMPLVLFSFISDYKFIGAIYIICLLGFFFYHHSHYSIIERYIKGRRFVVTYILILIVYTINFLSYIYHLDIFVVASTILLVVIMLCLFILTSKKKETNLDSAT